MMSEQEKQALISALKLLAATPKSREGLHEKLQERGYPPEVLEITLNRLEKQGILNDRSYAQSLFQTFLTQRPSGRRRIAFELSKRGIKAPVIQDILEDYNSEKERENALGLARAKHDRWLSLDVKKRRKKIYDFLLRRGFDFSIAREALDEVERTK